MNIAEILRKLADIADDQSDPGRPDDRIQNPAELGTVPGGLPVDAVDNTDAGQDDEVMVPPLQLKLELLKRAVGVDNVYDDQRADEVETTADDALAAIRRNAGIDSGGITAVVHGIAGEDEPLDQ
jgi:hypothetical protein